LRFALPALAGRLPRVEGFEFVEHLTVRVAPADAFKGGARRRIALSIEAAEMIWSCAAHIEDEELSAALRRLASHARINGDATGN
jgi:hypothetical protein